MILHNHTLSLHHLELIIINLPQKAVFRSGIGERKSRQTLLVKWTDADGHTGYGECSCRPDPYYSDEYLAAAVNTIRDFIVPRLKKNMRYGELLDAMDKIRGWPFTKAAVEAAAFHLVSQKTGLTPAEVLPIEPAGKVPVGISLGIYDDPGECYDIVAEAIAAGYRRIKFKIAPTVNTKVFDHINPLLFDNNVHTGFDANGSFSFQDLDKLDYFIKTYHKNIEQPFPPGRFDVYLAAMQQFPDLGVCYDEEVKSIGDLVKLSRLNALAELNLKVGRVGGISNSLEIIRYCREHRIPCWIGGMFETGIGRLLNLSFAACLPDAQAHDLSPSARYFEEDLISPEVTMDRGWITPAKMHRAEILTDRIAYYTTHSFLEKIKT